MSTDKKQREFWVEDIKGLRSIPMNQDVSIAYDTDVFKVKRDAGIKMRYNLIHVREVIEDTAEVEKVIEEAANKYEECPHEGVDAQYCLCSCKEAKSFIEGARFGYKLARGGK